MNREPLGDVTNRKIGSPTEKHKRERDAGRKAVNSFKNYIGRLSEKQYMLRNSFPRLKIKMYLFSFHQFMAEVSYFIGPGLSVIYHFDNKKYSDKHA